MVSLLSLLRGSVLVAVFAYLGRDGVEHEVPRTVDEWDKEYTYIVVGAGSAGAVMAGRLSEDRNVKVLLLEAGGNENMLSDIPLAAATLQMTPLDWAYQTEPQEASCFGLIHRRSRWPRGRVLGGSSVLNYMLYIRGNPRDYDHWASLGNYGWSWADVFPYFLKSEDNRDPSVASNGFHNVGGPLTVSTPPFVTPIGRAFPRAGEYLGYQDTDLNGAFQTGFSIPQGTVRRGARCSTAKAFLLPAKNRPNLHVVTFAYATKILINERKKAYGVQFDRLSMSHIVFARKEVIVSAGAVNTPQLLMLSGIGPRHHLESLGIPTIADLPVGYNLQDHIYSGGIHFIVNDEVSIVQRRTVTVGEFMKYITTGVGPLTALGGVEGLAFINTKYANHTEDHPDIEIHLLSGSLTSDDGRTFRRVQGLTEDAWRKVYKPYMLHDTFSLYPVLLRPKSRGYIKLRSTNAYEPPIIDPKYFTHPDDILTIVEGMKECIRVGNAPSYKALGAKLFQTIWPGCEIYKLWSDEYMACVARSYTATIYHPVGTAKMGPPGDPTAVVDPELRVYGLHGLRIVDGSIMPTIVSGNTNAPIIMIAEKISDLMRGRRLPPMYPPYFPNTLKKR